MTDCIPWDGPCVGAGEKCAEKGAAKRSCYGETTTPIPHPLMPLEGESREVWSQRVKLSLGKRSQGGGEGVVFIFLFVSHYSSLS